MLERIGARGERFARSCVPDPFVLALLLTLLCFGLSTSLTVSTPNDLLRHWYGGFWDLLGTAMRIVLVVIASEAIVESPIAQRALTRLAALPRTPRGAAFGLAFFSIALGWLHWGFGLVVSSVVARQVARSLHERKITAHYPIFGAAACMSLLLSRAGVTGTIPMNETHSVVCAALILIVPLAVAQLMPRRNILSIEKFDVSLHSPRRVSEEKPKTFAAKLERSYLTSAAVGCLGLALLTSHFAEKGVDFRSNHDVMNFLLLTIGILLHRHPMNYARAVSQSIKKTAGIVLQLPFYGGIMGMMNDSGLGNEIARWFSSLATQETLPFYAFLTGIVMKVFVPSGGSQWHPAGELAATGFAYGAMLGNMLQPFWIVPLLGITGLKARDVMGYCLVIFFLAFPILAIALLLP